jgi:hypothetical protein
MTTDKESALQIAGEILKRAIESIDSRLGAGYAAAHQLLLIQFFDGVFSVLAATAKRLPPAP